jgi:hypothetical protein
MARQRKPADAVQFTYESAERIANVVRAAETTPPSASPLTFDKRFADRMPKQVRVATFSGAWAIDSSKTVTFKYAPTATVNAVNLSWPITLPGYTAETCIVGREGTNWWLVVPKLEARTAVFVTQTQAGTNLVSIAIAATLNTNNCLITVSQTPSTTAITLITQTATSSYFRLRVP